jgi:hypothetical protein
MPSASAASRRKRPEMARRSYLQRIAEPLRAGEPVLFAVPGAGPEDARPATASAVVESGVASNPSTLRRAADRATSPSAVAKPERATQIVQTPRAVASSTAVDVNPAQVSMPSTAGPIAPAQSREFHTPVAPLETEAFAPLSPQARSAVAATTRTVVTERVAADFIDSEPLSSAEVVPPAVADASIDSPSAGEAQTRRDTDPSLRQVSPAEIDFEPISRQPPPLAVSKPRLRADTASPRIHIGTVEVRSAAPPPTPAQASTAAHAASRTDATPISRAYAWRFGLVQG